MYARPEEEQKSGKEGKELNKTKENQEEVRKERSALMRS